MARLGWGDLPDEVRTAVQDSIGPVSHSTDVGTGENNDLAVKLDRVGRPAVFLKGVLGGGRRGMFLHNEATAGRLALGIAPAVYCYVERNGWQVVAFEYIEGRPADLSPGAADLDRIGHTLDALSELSAGDARPLRLRWANTGYWRQVAEIAPDSVREWDIEAMCQWSARVPELVDGDRLLHTDPHRDQFLLTDDRVAVIDWAFPAAGAPWVDVAFLVLRLTGTGHTPAEAQRWARERSSWSSVKPDTITAWAVYVAGLWSWFAARQPLPGPNRRAVLARDYAAWCLSSDFRVSTLG